MFIVPDWSTDAKLVFAWVSCSLAMLLYTVVQIPYSALMGAMTADSQQRTSLSSFRFFFAFGGQFIVGAVTLYLIQFFGDDGQDEARGYLLTMVLSMVFATLIYVFTFLTTRERVSGEVEHATDVRGDLLALMRNLGWALLFVSALFHLVHVAVRNGSLLFYFDYYVGDESKASLFFSSGSAAFMAGVVCANFLPRGDSYLLGDSYLYALAHKGNCPPKGNCPQERSAGGGRHLYRFLQ